MEAIIELERPTWQAKRKSELLDRLTVLTNALTDLEAHAKNFRSRHMTWTGRGLAYKTADIAARQSLDEEWRRMQHENDRLLKERSDVLAELAHLS